MQLTTITALFLIIVPIAFNVTFILLAREFEYPDILCVSLRITILRKFKAGGPLLLRGLTRRLYVSPPVVCTGSRDGTTGIFKPICPLASGYCYRCIGAAWFRFGD